MVKRLVEYKTHPVPTRPSRTGMASPFVGRDGEMDRLVAALDLASGGQGGTIFLTGQPGIGRTRLAREALAMAKGRGFRVLEGRTNALDVGLAYAPLIDAFRPLLRSYESPEVTSLVGDLPELGRLFGWLRLPAPEPLGDPRLEKTRMFEAVLRLVERLTQEAPVVLFIDDLHWADPATFELLQYLARGLSDQPVLLLIAYRDNVTDTSHALQTFVRSVRRSVQSGEVVVPRLSPAEADRLVKGILGEEAPPGLLDLLESRARGTPLFIIELVAALLDSGSLACSPSDKNGWVFNVARATALPPGIRDLILERLGRLERVDRHVLDLLAVTGDATSHAVLLSASALDEASLLEALQRLQAPGLVSEEMNRSEVVYGVTHPLVQEVAYAELPEMERRRAHMAAIAALEPYVEGRPENVRRLARHYRGAGPETSPERALSAYVAAGEQARSVFANEEAAEHYAAALAIVREGQRSSGLAHSDERLLPWLLERLGEVWKEVGKVNAAIEVWNEVLAGQRRAGDMVATARLFRQLARAEWERGQFNAVKADVEAGLTALAGCAPCQELADLHYIGFAIHYRLGEAAGMAKMLSGLLSVAGQLGSPQVEAAASLAASFSCLGQGDVVKARQHGLQALKISEQAQELAILCRAHGALVRVGMCLGDHQFMAYHAERGLALARRLGGIHLEALYRLRLTYANFLSGAWEEAICCSTEAIALSRRVDWPRNLVVSLSGRLMILVFRGETTEAENCISEVRTAIANGAAVDRHISGLVDIAETALALEREEVQRALEIAVGFNCLPSSAASPAGLPIELLPMGMMLLAETLVAAGDPERALATARLLVDLGPADSPYVTALASRAEGLARGALGQGEVAMSCLAQAHQAFLALKMPFEAARVLLEQGAFLAAEQPDQAVKAAQQSLTALDRLGARRYVARARTLLRRLCSSPLAKQHLSRARQGQLSERQIEIALLGAKGLSTPEIAERLFLSQRTVSTHLAHIYARLGINSRAALALYVIRSGLLPQTENT